MQILLLSALATFSACKEIDSNDISIPPPPINLDSNLRKALLRALTELENEDREREEENNKNQFISTTESDKIIEKASASAVSIVANDDGTTEVTTEKPIVVVQKSDGFQHKPIVVDENFPESGNGHEEFLASASSSFTSDKNFESTQRSRSVGNNINHVTLNDKTISAGAKSVSITPKNEVTTPISTTTTEESQAKVEDVQFFSAPLVAAFTVHQDERGLPKKVEPIYKVAGQTSISSKDLEIQERFKQSEILRQQQLQQEQARNQQEQIRSQFQIQEKQKSLEAQVFNLQQHQKHQQDYLLRQQQILLEQQLQNHKFLSEQQRQKQNEQPFVPIINPNQNQFKNEFGNIQTQLNNNVATQLSNNIQTQLSNSARPQLSNIIQPPLSNNVQTQFSNVQNQFSNNGQAQLNNNVQTQINNNAQTQFSNTFNQNQANTNQFNQNNNRFNSNVVVQPSLSLLASDLQSGNLPLNAQVLPIRNAIDFHQSPITPNNVFYTPLTPPVVQQQNQAFRNFQSFPNNFVQSLPLRQGNRVFRQESSVGNFGINQFNNFQQNRFFRSNLEGFQNTPFYQPQNANQQLNKLLFHSGITRNVRQNDDLNIVSKILSYNVGRDNFFDGSRVSEQRLHPATQVRN